MTTTRTTATTAGTVHGARHLDLRDRVPLGRRRVGDAATPKQLRVVHVLARMPASGTERQLAGMLRAAPEVADDRHALVVLYPGFPLAAELADDGIEVVELPDAAWWSPSRLTRLAGLLDDLAPDVVHTSLWGGSMVGRTVAGLRRHRPALVMSERRVEDFRAGWQRGVDRVLARVTDAWIGNSPSVTAFIRRAHGVDARRVHLVPNGIDTSVFRPQPAPLAGSRAVVGAVGRLVDQKGFDVLVDAVALVRRHHDVALAIVGDGPLRGDLERQAASRMVPLHLRGFMDDPADVAGFLGGLDVFAMSSRYEGLPNALLEAQACGIPAVATDAPGIADACGPQTALVAPEDPVALAEGIVAQLGRGRVRPAAQQRTFVDVAADHREVFLSAVRRRAAR